MLGAAAVAVAVLTLLAHNVSCFRIRNKRKEHRDIASKSKRDRSDVLMPENGTGEQSSWASVYTEVSGSDAPIRMEQPGAMGGPNDVSLYDDHFPGMRLNATADGDKLTTYQMLTPEEESPILTLSNGVITSSDGEFFTKKDPIPPNVSDAQNIWAGEYQNASGSGGTITIEQPGAMGGPNSASISYSEHPGLRVNATVDGDTMTLIHSLQQVPPEVATRSNGVVTAPNGTLWVRETQIMDHKAENDSKLMDADAHAPHKMGELDSGMLGHHNIHGGHIHLDGHTDEVGATVEDSDV